MARLIEIAKNDGFGRGAETVQLSTSRLRFNPGNLRQQYGFTLEHEDYILSVIQEKYLDNSFTEEDSKFITSNLVDPSVESNPESREFRKSMKWLVNSICDNGVVDPIRGYWDSEKEIFVNTDGNRRLAAIIVARLLGTEIKSVKVLQEETKTTSADFEASVLRRQLLSNSGKEFNPIEEAKVLSRLKALGSSETELISLAGSKAILTARLALLDLAKPVQQAVSNGDVLPTVALSVTQEAIENGISHEEVAEGIQQAVEQVKKDRKEGKTKASKASAKQVSSAIKATAEKNGKVVEKKVDDPKKKADLLANVKYMIENLNALDDLSVAKLTEVFKILNKS